MLRQRLLEERYKQEKENPYTRRSNVQNRYTGSLFACRDGAGRVLQRRAKPGRIPKRQKAARP